MKPELASFMESYILINLIKSETYFKNCKSCLKNTSTLETGFGDHHHLIYSIFKTTFRNEEPENIFYRDYSQINPANFKLDLEDSGLKQRQVKRKILEIFLIIKAAKLSKQAKKSRKARAFSKFSVI